jgi:group I intron endonuclease
MASGIYCVENTTTGDFYFGSAVLVARRWRQHRHNLRRGKHENPRLQRAWDKYGEAAFVWEHVLDVDGPEMLAIEQRLVDRLIDRPDCYNICRQVSAGRTGIKHTPEAREKMARALRGRKHSPETRAKMSASQRGRTRSAESNAKSLATLRSRPESMARVRAGQFKDGHEFVGRPRRKEVAGG